ncbi:MAG: hypothetical protein AAF290_16840 [Pseudomonadota bacterium]
MRTLTILITVNFLAACSGDAHRTPDGSAGSTPIERYAKTTSPDGEVEALVYHYDSPSGGLTQVSLDFVGLGCGSGSAAWYAYDIGIELRWLDAHTLEVTYPEDISFRHNPSGEYLGCFDRTVRVVMVPRKN